jgi:hypothetical protein
LDKTTDEEEKAQDQESDAEPAVTDHCSIDTTSIAHCKGEKKHLQYRFIAIRQRLPTSIATSLRGVESSFGETPTQTRENSAYLINAKHSLFERERFRVGTIASMVDI